MSQTGLLNTVVSTNLTLPASPSGATNELVRPVIYSNPGAYYSQQEWATVL